MKQTIGRYRIQGELGRGGFGRVYRAFDPTVGRQVAVKTLVADGDEELIVRFRNEAAAAGRLHHKNIVTIHDFGEDNGEPFIVMELLEGMDLHKLLVSRIPLSLVQKMRIMAEVADALQHAHRHGVVHRDIKPANIMVRPDGSVKIMDFGIALVTQASTRLTKTGLVPGTLRYMAPEQFNGQDADALGDIFSYGVTYYEFLTGVHPFEAPSQPALMYRVMSVDPDPLRDHLPECPEALQAALGKALAKSREQRFQSMEDLQLDMRPIQIEAERVLASELAAQATRLVSSGDENGAYALVRESLALDPSNAEAVALRRRLQADTNRQAVRPKIDDLVATGRHRIAQGQYQAAIQTLEAALRLDNSDETIPTLLEEARSGLRRLRQTGEWIVTARQQVESGNYQEAEASALRVLQGDPTNLDAAALLDTVRHKRAAATTSGTQVLPVSPAVESTEKRRMPKWVFAAGAGALGVIAAVTFWVTQPVPSEAPTAKKEAVVAQQQPAPVAVPIEPQSNEVQPPPPVRGTAPAPAQPAPAPAARQGVVMLSAGQEGAYVFVDNKLYGVTDGQGRLRLSMSPGSHGLRVDKQGFESQPASRDIRIEAGEQQDVALQLRRVVETSPQQQQQAATPQPAEPPQWAAAAAEWDRVRGSANVARMEEFLKKYPNAPQATAARQLVDDLRWSEWNKGDVASLKEFASRYPDSAHVRQAQQMAARLETEAREAAAAAQRAAEQQKQAENARGERNAIYAALARYVSAFEKKDIDALRAAYPDIPASSVEQMKRAFSNRSVRMTMSLQPLSDPEIRGNAATLQCQVSTITVANGRSSNSAPRKVTLHLVKRGNEWVIQNLQN